MSLRNFPTYDILENWFRKSDNRCREIILQNFYFWLRNYIIWPKRLIPAGFRKIPGNGFKNFGVEKFEIFKSFNFDVWECGTSRTNVMWLGHANFARQNRVFSTFRYSVLLNIFESIKNFTVGVVLKLFGRFIWRRLTCPEIRKIFGKVGKFIFLNFCLNWLQMCPRVCPESFGQFWT